MYVGDQNFGVTPLEMEFLARHGVTHIDANRGLPNPLTLEAMIAHREAAAQYGITLVLMISFHRCCRRRRVRPHFALHLVVKALLAAPLGCAGDDPRPAGEGDNPGQGSRA